MSAGGAGPCGADPTSTLPLKHGRIAVASHEQDGPCGQHQRCVDDKLQCSRPTCRSAGQLPAVVAQRCDDPRALAEEAGGILARINQLVSIPAIFTANGTRG